MTSLTQVTSDVTAQVTSDVTGDLIESVTSLAQFVSDVTAVIARILSPESNTIYKHLTQDDQTTWKLGGEVSEPYIV